MSGHLQRTRVRLLCLRNRTLFADRTADKTSRSHHQNVRFVIARAHYARPFSSAMTLPQLVSESSVIALLFATFSIQSRQANSSLSGINCSMAGEMVFPISRPHFLHFTSSGNDIKHLLRSVIHSMNSLICPSNRRHVSACHI
jgi:hypothetical protein